MEILLSCLDQNLNDKDKFYRWYFELAFWTGFRLSEMITLRKSDIDWHKGIFKVNKSRVHGLEKKFTKTHTSRDFYLNERSSLVLKSFIHFKKDHNYKSDYLMLCSETSHPFSTKNLLAYV